MTAKTGARPRRPRGRVDLPPTLGPLVCEWIERFCVFSQGDFFGQPFRLTEDQRRFLWRCYELDADGSRRFRRVVRGRPTGAGKTELAAAIACAELAGPVRFAGFRDRQALGKRVTSPDVIVAAASFEQADVLFGAARVMGSEGPLAEFVECHDTELQLRRDPGKMRRVAAAAGTNEGLRPTFFVADEVHEWTDRRRRVHIVIAKSLAKRLGSWSLSITTAGVLDAGSVAEDEYDYGQRVLAGEVDDPAFLFDWLEAPDVDFADPVALEAAVRHANPEPFVPIEYLLQRVGQLPEHEARRYHLNQWVRPVQTWAVADRWSELAAEQDVPDGTPVALGFDGSYSGDATALVGCTLDEPHHLFVVHVQERPDGTPDSWRVDVDAAEQAIRDACARYRVVSVGCDPFRWQRSMQILLDEGLPIVEWPTTSAPRMVGACAQFTDAALADTPGVSHDGDPALARHVANCVLKVDGRGPRIVKEHKQSAKRIDLAVAAVLAFDGALRGEPTQLEPLMAWR